MSHLGFRYDDRRCAGTMCEAVRLQYKWHGAVVWVAQAFAMFVIASANSVYPIAVATVPNSLGTSGVSSVNCSCFCGRPA